jgi:competence protein ComEC
VNDAAPLDVRLVPAALTGWAVTATAIVWRPAGAVLVIAVAMAATVALAWWGAGRPDGATTLRVAAASLAGVAVVGTAFALATALRVQEADNHPLSRRFGTVATVTVTPTESPRAVGGGRLMFRGALRTVDGAETSGSVLVFASPGRFAELTAGTPARFSARVERPLRRDLSVATLSATGSPVLGQASPVQRAAAALRSGFAERSRTVLPADQAALLPALALGDTSGLTSQTVADFRVAGLTHLTAVSGANVTIVCGAVLLSAALIGPRAAVGLAALALLGFVVVVQPSASVQRAAVMGAITLLAVLSRRRRQAIPALCGCVLVLLVGAPELAVDIGFALSVSATAALVVLAPRWSRRLTGRGWPKPLADAVSVAVAAQLVTAPLVAGISGTVSVVSVAANLAVTPTIPPITVLGTAAAALAPVWPAGAELLIRFTGPELWWLLHVARWAAAVPGAAVAVPAGPVGVLLVASAGVAGVLAWRWRATRIAAALLAVGTVAWTVARAIPIGAVSGA